MKCLAIAFFVLISALSAIAQEPQTSDKDVKLKIISKPNATYSAEARRRGISGNVKLRVEFLASGKIGQITDLTEADKAEFEKFGLTKNSIKAAKQIEFSPARKDGKPITVSRTVIYTFSLY